MAFGIEAPRVGLLSIGEEAEHSSEKYELHPRAVCPPIHIGKTVVELRP